MPKRDVRLGRRGAHLRAGLSRTGCDFSSRWHRGNQPGWRRAVEWRSAPGVRLPFSDSGGVWRDRNRGTAGTATAPVPDPSRGKRYTLVASRHRRKFVEEPRWPREWIAVPTHARRDPGPARSRTLAPPELESVLLALRCLDDPGSRALDQALGLDAAPQVPEGAAKGLRLAGRVELVIDRDVVGIVDRPHDSVATHASFLAADGITVERRLPGVEVTGPSARSAGSACG